MVESYKMQVWRKTVAARHGDKAALNWLERENDKQVNRANRTLNAFARRGFRTKAATKLVAFSESMFDTDRLQTTASMDLTPDQMWRQINMASHFNQLKSSSVKGFLEVRENRIEGMRRIGVWGFHEDEEGHLVPNDPPNKVKANRFLRFLGDIDVQSYLDYGESSQVVRAMAEAYIERGYSLKKIQMLWDNFASDDNFDAVSFVNKLAGRRGNTYADLVQSRRRFLRWM